MKSEQINDLSQLKEFESLLNKDFENRKLKENELIKATNRNN